MRALARLRSFLVGLFFARRIEREMDEEWQFHLDARTETLVASGQAREDARRQARREFGPPAKWKEHSRDAHGLRLIHELWQDSAFALRQMRRAPGFTLVAICALALGIGANTAIFSVINGVLLRPLPFKNADQLVRIVDNNPADDRGGARRTAIALDIDEVTELRGELTTLSHVGVYVGANITLNGRDEPVRLRATRMSASFFPMLGDEPVLGRGFNAREEVSGQAVVVLSFGTWQQYLGGRTDILGQHLLLDERPHTVIGVMPRGFAFPDALTDIWTPFVPVRTPGRL